jgi:hypothetical protein
VSSRVLPWQNSHTNPFEVRQDRCLQGTLLAVPAALLFFPAWVFLVHTPRFVHSYLLSVPVFAALAGMLVSGITKLVRCIDMRDFDIVSAMAAGVLMIIFVAAVYTSILMFALVYPGLPPDHYF